MHRPNDPRPPVERLLATVQQRPVLLDSDLARLLELPLARLRGLLWENYEQFPGELCFQPDPYELPDERRSAHANVFTEQGVWMIATVLGTRAALDVALKMSLACAAHREQRRFGSSMEVTGYR